MLRRMNSFTRRTRVTMLIPLRNLAEIPDVDEQSSTRVGQFCVSLVESGS